MNTARLIHSRRLAQLSQREVAYKLSITLEQYKAVEHGAPLSDILVVNLAKVIGVTPSYLKGKS